MVAYTPRWKSTVRVVPAIKIGGQVRPEHFVAGSRLCRDPVR